MWVINADGWLSLPQVRFRGKDPARHFYHNALRFDEMFSRWIRPLRSARSIEVIADQIEETAKDFHPHDFKFIDLDVILLEGIFLFKNEFRSFFDLKIWIDCSYDVALQRAIARGQEGLSWEATVRAYETIYFPAERPHFEIDDPRSCADVIFPNP
jgi:uridine kinase